MTSKYKIGDYVRVTCMLKRPIGRITQIHKTSSMHYRIRIPSGSDPLGYWFQEMDIESLPSADEIFKEMLTRPEM